MYIYICIYIHTYIHMLYTYIDMCIYTYIHTLEKAAADVYLNVWKLEVGTKLHAGPPKLHTQ